MVSITELRVKELLREKGWTTKTLAEKTGMSESYLTHIKNATRRWNEDILLRLAEAFDVHPVELFVRRKRVAIEDPLPMLDEQETHTITPLMVPLMRDIPANPSPHNNEVMQITSGMRGEFIPALGFHDPDMFCVVLDNNNMKPIFVRGDYLIVSPQAEIKTGDIVAVEYKDKVMHRAFMQVNFANDLVILESVNHRHSPVALPAGSENYRFIGKVVMRYQSLG